MKRIFEFIIVAVVVILILASCSSDNDKVGFININGTSYALTYGLVNDVGIIADIKNYWIRFQSTNGDKPAYFIVFKLYSTSSDNIGEGTYTYKDLPGNVGEFSWTKVGYDLQYNEAGEKVAGTILLDSQVDEGTIIITKDGDYNKFEFNIVFSINDITYTVTGDFKDILHEGNVFYSDIIK